MSADSTHKNISETAYTGGPTSDGIATIIAASDQRLTDIEVLIADRVKGDAMANWFERRLLAAPDAVWRSRRTESGVIESYGPPPLWRHNWA